MWWSNLRQAAGRLLQIHAAPHTRLHPLRQAAVHIGMCDEVVACKLQQLAVAQHIQVGARGFLRSLVSDVQQFVISCLPGMAQTANICRCGETVKQGLPQLDIGG